MARRFFVRASVSVVVVLAWTNLSPAQSDTESANAIMPGCRAFNSGPGTSGNMFLRGLCYGTIQALGWVGQKQYFCVPDQVTGAQLVQVVRQHIENRPAELHRNFKELAMEALMAAWPCKNR